ncbi:MAG: SCP2 sterol-binding domain-containing protein [Anaerolineae bacterium]|nr:SCP2 sterol-binding domain-containing protein [Thermoflexales bacterium]MDW8395763.1 SCP2 sterol-binding domain-containing protein [Anaerolineae bacterium]
MSQEPIPFATPEWVAAFKAAINASAGYREAARTWEGDFWFILEPEKEGDRRVLMYVDLWHGECRAAELAETEDGRTPEFRIAAPLRQWKRVITREIDPIRALVTGALKLQGNLAKIMRNVRAAQELVLCAASVPTRFET